MGEVTNTTSLCGPALVLAAYFYAVTKRWASALVALTLMLLALPEASASALVSDDPEVLEMEHHQPDSSPTNVGLLTWSVTFSDQVYNVDASDCEITGATAPLNASIDTQAIFHVTASNDDLAGLNSDITLNVLGANGIGKTDRRKPRQLVSKKIYERMYTLDNDAPKVAISSITNEFVSELFGVDYYFAETVNYLELSDTIVGNGSASGFAGSSAGYFATITPNSDETIIIDVAANVATDAAGNRNSAASGLSRISDASPRIASIERFRPDGSPALNGGHITWRVTFNENVQNVSVGDFSVSGTTGTLSVTNVSSRIYDVSASGGDMANLTGTITLSVAGWQDIEDASGNPLVETTPTGANENFFALAARAGALDSEFLVNTTTSTAQQAPNVASLTTGGFVIAWQDRSQSGGDTSDWAIRAQRYDTNGVAAGSEFLANTTTFGAQAAPSVAALTGGGFIISWQDNSQSEGDGDSTAIRAQRFDANGSAVGSEFLVNTTTSGSQILPSLAGLSDGGFVIVWQDNSQSGGDASSWAIRAQRYDANGNALGTEFLVNSTTSGIQQAPSVAGLTGGGFVITWHDHSQTGGDTSSFAIRAQHYDGNGNPTGGEFLVNTTTFSAQQNPSVAGLSDGGFVIAWQDFSQTSGDVSNYAVYWQRFDVNASAIGGEFLANATTSGAQRSPRVGALAGGGFVIAWQDDSQSGGDSSDWAIRAQRLDANGHAAGEELLVNTTTASGQQAPNVAGLSNGEFIIVWQDSSQTGGDTSDWAIRAQHYSVSQEADTSAPLIASIERHRPDASPALNGGHATWRVTFDESVQNVDVADFAISGTTGTLSVTQVSSKIHDVAVSGGDMAALTGTITLSVAGGQNIQDSSGNAFVDTTPTDVNENSFELVSLQAVAGPEFLVNSTTSSIQQAPSVAGLTGGGFVAAWQDRSQTGGDTSVGAIRAQRYNANGNVVGGEFLVNSTTFNAQSAPSVAALNGGGFVIAWEDISQTGGDTSGWAIRAQRYDVNGNAAGGEFLVNSTTSSDQSAPSVAALVDGGFIIAWHDESQTGGDTSNWAIRAQRFDANGYTLGGEFLVNPTTSDAQLSPSVAGLSDGGFVISWQDSSQTGGDTFNWAIRAQRFDANSSGAGSEILVNTTTSRSQQFPSVAGLSGGGFVIAWQDNSNIFADIRAQRFDAGGSAVGSELLVNTISQLDQELPSVSALAGGGFVVSWQDGSEIEGGGDEDSTAVRAQRYDANGNALGSEFLVNTTTNSAQQAPSAGGLTSGGFVIAWQDYSFTGGDTSDWAVRAQRYSLNDETPPSVIISSDAGAIVSGAFTATFTFSETVTGFELADIVVGNGAASNFSGSGTSYSATITPTADGIVTVDVAQGVTSDNAGNGNTAASQFSVTNDQTAPSLDITGPAGPVLDAFTATFEFSENVTGFTLDDIAVGNGAASNLQDNTSPLPAGVDAPQLDGTSFTATITPDADGEVTIDVAAGAVQDDAGFTNTAATQFSIQALFDKTLTVALSGLGSGTVSSSPSGIDCGSDCDEAFAHNAEVTLTATPDAGSSFAGWLFSDCGDPDSMSCVLTMDTGRSATARFTLDEPPDGRIVAAALPGARSSYIGGPVITVFLSVVSRATTPAQSCEVSAPAGAPFTLSYQELNGATPVGPVDPVFDLNNGGSISLLIAMTPTAQTAAAGYVFLPQIACDNANLTPIEGVSSVLVSIGAGPVPDILSIGATPSNDGVVRIPATGNRIAFMAASAVNIGAGDSSAGANQATVTAAVDTGAASLPVTLEVCEAGGSGCVTPRGETSVQTVFDQNVAKTFTVFVRANGEETVAFSPANSRVFLRFTDANGVVRTVTSAAISAPPPADEPQPAVSMAGRWSVLVRQSAGSEPILNRASLYLADHGEGILEDGITQRRVAFEDVRITHNEALTAFAGYPVMIDPDGALIAGDALENQPQAFWGVRDTRDPAATNWAAHAGQYGDVHINDTGEIRGTIDGCGVYGDSTHGGLTPVSLTSCDAEGEYLATIDVPANDTAPALLIAGETRGWRLIRGVQER